jgi:ABC-type branched-subunit amino acid transport system substrate-binding protein
MRTVKFVLLLVVFSVAPSLSTLGQTSELPFKHTACAKGVDLTGQKLTLYHIIDPHDQVDTIYNPIRAGYLDAAEYFNAHGGICGATLVQGFDETGETDTGMLYLKFAALIPKPVLVTLYGSGIGEDLASQLAHDQIPALNIRSGSSTSAYGTDGQTLGWAFATNPLYVDQLGAMCKYIADNPQHFPKPVIGFMNFDDPWAGSATMQAQSYCLSLGIGYAGASSFNNDSVIISTHMQKLIDAGANIIYTNSLERGPALVAKTLAEMGLKDKVTLAAVNRAMEPYVAFSAEKDLDADGLPVISGMLGSVPILTWSEHDHPGIRLITQLADLHKRPLTMRTDSYIMGWDTTDLFIEVYIQTGNRVGFEHITGADIKTTLENIVYQPLGGVERIDYHGGKRRALAENRIGVMKYLGKDGKTFASATNPPMIAQEGDQQHLVPMIVPLTDYQPAPDLRPGGVDVPSVKTASVKPIATANQTTPMVSSIGGKIAFNSDRDGNAEIYVMNADGSAPVNLTNNPADDFGPIWSYDGKKLLFTSTRDGNAQVYVMNQDGSNPINVSKNSANDVFGALSPDGTQVAFVSDRGGRNHVYLMNADGSNQTQLTNLQGTDEFPGWSPDGKTIVFMSSLGGANGDIYTIHVDGTGLVDLTNSSADDGLPMWSPDGTRITFTSNRDGSEEVYVMNPDGSGVVQLTFSNSPIYNHKSAWSSDGKQLAFVSTRDGNAEIYAMNADGSNLIRLTNNPYEDEVPAWQMR